MDKFYKKIIEAKQKEAREIRRGFSEQILKAAAYSVGGEVRSLEVDIREARAFPVFVEIKSILFLRGKSKPEFLKMEGFNPVRAVKELERAGLGGGVVVSTDRDFLGGDPGWINLVKNNSALAVMQRDFFVDPVQFYQGKAIGADAFLISAAFAEERALPGLISAGGEMGLEVYLEIEESRLPAAVNPEDLSGVVMNFFPPDSGELQVNDFAGAVRALPGNLLKIARMNPRTPGDLTFLKELGMQALILADEFWQSADFLSRFQRISSWCNEVFPKGRN